MPFIRFSIDNPLIVNLILILILIIGISAWYSMPQEIFPLIELDIVSIRTEFEGASPEEVEQQITLPIEEEFEDSHDIDYISSSSNEGYSSIVIRLKPGSDVDNFMRDARTILDRIDNLPDLAKEPELNRVRTRFPVITLTLFGGIANAELYSIAERVRRQMLQVDGVASVGLAGDREWEIWVVVDPHELAALHVPLTQLMSALRDNLRDQPGGTIKSTEGDIRLRGKGIEPDPVQMENIVIRSNVYGGQLRLGDVARVDRRFEEPLTYARFGGQPSVNLIVTKTAQASTIEVARLIRELANEFRQTLPASVNVGLHTDVSVYVKNRLNVVKSSGLLGLVLLLIALCLLINFRVALITAFGIPVSFLVAVVLMYYFAYTINMVSLFAFLIVLGMIVDDAIIVTENVYRHMEKGIDSLQAATLGAREVFWPVVVSTFTTIAAFVPMYSIGGILGEFIKVIPLVVTCALLGSLLEAFIVLPSHAAHFLRYEKVQRKQFIDWSRWLEKYSHALHWSLMNRYTVAVASTGILIISIVYANTRIPYQQFGDVEIGQFFLNIEAPNTYSLDNTLALTEQLENVILETVKENELDTMLANVGYSIIDFQRSKSGSNLIQFIIDLKKPASEGFIETWISPVVSMDLSSFGTRTRSTEEIIDNIRLEFQKFSGVKRLSVLRPQAGPAGNDIEIGIVGDNIELLESKADEISEYLRRMPGVHDVQHDQEPGKLEYQYELNDRGRRLGITQSQLASAVRSGYLGVEVVHVNWNRKRIPVRLIYPESTRRARQ